jgi:DNA polymerase-1
MIVTKQTFPEILARLRELHELAFDTETTGLRPFSGDRVFSIIIAESVDTAHYFNFNPLEEKDLLGEPELCALRILFGDRSKTWYAHNAIFDCLMLKESFDIDVTGTVFCTFAQGRVEYNEHFQYSLAASLKRIGGEQKDDKVSEYIKTHGLKTLIAIPDKKEPYEVLHFDRVPIDIMAPYACTDARSTFGLGVRINQSIKAKSAEVNPGNPTLEAVSKNELRLHHVLVRSTRRGLLLDQPYIRRAIQYERERLHGAVREFESLSGARYVNHFKTFERVFASERAKFSFGEKTKTGQINPVFDEDALKRLENPLAKEVLKARDAQGKLNFYNAYLFYADKNGVLHPNMVSGGTNTGRFSSNEPNMQNITSEDLMTCKGCGKGYETITEICEKCKGVDFERPEFLVRRAFVPRPDYCFFNPDYSSQEYRMMLDMAKKLYDSYRVRTGLPPVGMEYYELLRKIKEENYDVHQATAEMVGVSRTEAKTVNFALLYGAGVNKMAAQLGINSDESSDLRYKYFKALPYVQFFIKTASRTAETRGYVKNWLGRHNYMGRDWAYKAPNQLIQGGCADVMKVLMVRLDEMLKGTKSHQLLSIHDEDIIEMHYSEIDSLPQRIIETMETIYPHDYLPLTASAEWSEISLADKRKGYPVWTPQSLRA